MNRQLTARPLWPKTPCAISPSISGRSIRRLTAYYASYWSSTARWSSASTRISVFCTAEKLIEHKTYLQALPYLDRLDYVAPMNLLADVAAIIGSVDIVFGEIDR